MTIEPHIDSHPLFIEPGHDRRNADFLRRMRFGSRSSFNPRNGQLVAAQCQAYDCGNLGGFASTSYCRDCALDLWAMVQRATTEGERAAKMNGEYADMLTREAEAAHMDALAKSKRSQMTTPGHVYYLRVGNLIKIGFTTDIARRMNEYPPNAAVLAAHPGTQRTERDMHRKFSAHLAKGREWFTPNTELDEHIITVNNQYPLAETRCIWTGETLNLAA